jgi:hypothetical protein
VEETTPKVGPTEFYRNENQQPFCFDGFRCRALRADTSDVPAEKKADDATCATRSASASTAVARPRSRRARDSYRPRGPFGAARLVKASRASQRV